MKYDFNLIASSRTDMELEERIENRQHYLPETVEATVAELKISWQRIFRRGTEDNK